MEKVSEKRLKELLEKERRLKKMKEINKRSYKRRNARIKLMLRKAEKAGITVSDKEVDEYLKNKK